MRQSFPPTRAFYIPRFFQCQTPFMMREGGKGATLRPLFAVALEAFMDHETLIDPKANAQTATPIIFNRLVLVKDGQVADAAWCAEAAHPVTSTTLLKKGAAIEFVGTIALVGRLSSNFANYPAPDTINL